MACGWMVPEEQHGRDPLGKKASARSEWRLGCPRHRQRSLAIFEKLASRQRGRPDLPVNPAFIPTVSLSEGGDGTIYFIFIFINLFFPS